MSKIEQFMNQSLLIKDGSNNIIKNNESAYFTNYNGTTIMSIKNTVKNIINKYYYFDITMIKEILIKVKESVKLNEFGNKYEVNLTNTFINPYLYCVNKFNKECYLSFIQPKQQIQQSNQQIQQPQQIQQKSKK